LARGTYCEQAEYEVRQNGSNGVHRCGNTFRLGLRGRSGSDLGLC